MPSIWYLSFPPGGAYSLAIRKCNESRQSDGGNGDRAILYLVVYMSLVSRIVDAKKEECTIGVEEE